jgi:hypothetical protein
MGHTLNLATDRTLATLTYLWTLIETSEAEGGDIRGDPLGQRSLFDQISEDLPEHRQELEPLPGVATTEEDLADPIDDESVVR